MPKRGTEMTYATVQKMLLGWPGVQLSTSYGRPSLKVNGKFFTWLKEDGDSITVGGVDFDERDMLMESQGDVFYITDHYRNSRYVLITPVEGRPGHRRNLSAPPLVRHRPKEAACRVRPDARAETGENENPCAEEYLKIAS